MHIGTDADTHTHAHEQKSQIIISNHYNLDRVALRSNAWNCVYLELLVVFFVDYFFFYYYPMLLFFVQVFYVYVQVFSFIFCQKKYRNG